MYVCHLGIKENKNTKTQRMGMESLYFISHRSRYFQRLYYINAIIEHFKKAFFTIILILILLLLARQLLLAQELPPLPTYVNHVSPLSVGGDFLIFWARKSLLIDY